MKNKLSQIALQTTLVYWFASSIWILLSDRALLLFSADPEVISTVSMYKGWGFVIVTAALLYVSIRGQLVRWEHEVNERKKAEQILRQNQTLLSEALHIAHLAYWEYSPETDLLELNNQFYSVFRTTAEREGGYQVSSTRFRSSFVHPDDRELVAHEVEQALSSSDHQYHKEFDHRALFADGGQGWVTVRLRTEKGASGRTSKLYGTCMDITSRKRNEGTLRESEEKFRTIFRSSPLGIAISEFPSGVFVNVNDSFLALFGYSREEVLDHTYVELGMWADEEERKRMIRELSENGRVEQFEARLRRKDGKTLHSAISAERIELDGRSYLMGMLSDISTRKKAEEALRENEERLRLTLAAANAGAFEWVVSTNSVYWSDEVYQLLGTEKESQEPSMENWLRAVHPEDRMPVQRQLQQLLAAGTADLYLEFRLSRPDGTTRWLANIGKVNYDNDGQPDRVTAIVIDIDERKRAEKQLKASEERLRQLSGYLQNVREEERKRIAREIHDELGQELTALKMEVSLAQKASANIAQPNGKAKFLEQTNSIMKIADGAIRTVRRISAELRPDVLDQLGLVDAIDWQTKEFQKRSGIECVFRSESPRQPLSDEIATAILRIYQEALTNIARHAGASKIDANLTFENNVVCLRVADNGRGVTEQEISHASSFGVMGMSERAIHLGGSVRIEGEKGKGTSVQVWIPVLATH